LLPKAANLDFQIVVNVKSGYNAIQDASPDTRRKTPWSLDFLAQITKSFEIEK